MWAAAVRVSLSFPCPVPCGAWVVRVDGLILIPHTHTQKSETELEAEAEAVGEGAARVRGWSVLRTYEAFDALHCALLRRFYGGQVSGVWGVCCRSAVMNH